MSDPYEVLGIGRGATNLEIKAIYRELAKKYHPDNYNGSPLRDVAEEKMSQINQAFDAIKQERKWDGKMTENTEKSATRPNQNSYYNGAHTSSFADIRGMIQQNRLEEAQALLEGVQTSQRDAEWFFLQATIYFSRGWFNEASTHFQTAHRMQPNNPEYRAASQRMQWQGQGNFGAGYGQSRQNYRTTNGQTGCGVCDICAGLVCLDCFCQCCGGDLISCC